MNKAEKSATPGNSTNFWAKNVACSNGNITLFDKHGNPIALDPNLNADTLLNHFFPDDNPDQVTQYHKNTKLYVSEFLKINPWIRIPNN